VVSTDRHQSDIAGVPEMRLRPPRPRVVRLSRKVLAGLGAAAAVAIGAALIFALQSKGRGHETPKETYNTERRATADGLASLPADYSQIPRQVPRLGPPLPGDLGRPMLGSDMAAATTPALSGMTNGRAAQGVANERDAWETSHLFVSTAAHNGGSSAQGSSALAADVRGQGTGNANSTTDHNRAFLEQAADRRTVSAERIQDTPSPFVIQAGAVIAAALITGIRSDLPGQVTAQVTESVYDSPTGQHLLIPQGARLVGVYDSQVAFGQSRVLLVWTRLIFPDGRSIVLERLPAADAAGFAGLEDGVNYHWGRMFLAAGLSSLLGIGAELGSNNNSDSQISRAIRDGFQDTVNQTGREIVRRQIDVQPTLTIRPGFPVRVMVNRDLVIEPYEN
jgi:type IV secretion system protein VirB10